MQVGHQLQVSVSICPFLVSKVCDHPSPDSVSFTKAETEERRKQLGFLITAQKVTPLLHIDRQFCILIVHIKSSLDPRK